MYIATHKTTASAPVISERNQSNQNSKVKSAKSNALSNEQVSTAPDDATTLRQGSLARLLASCGDCV
ncbi:MAG TPA: hypothetical protein VK967_05545 [Methylotenera sp.]|nr:hypothetical protein [Methylotenera sp.]